MSLTTMCHMVPDYLKRSALWLIKSHEQEDEAVGSKQWVSGCWHWKLTVIDNQKMGTTGTACLQRDRDTPHVGGSSF